MKVIIVEDEAIVAQDLAVRVEGYGFVVSKVFNSSKGVLSYVIQKVPDIVLMDINLNDDLNGLELVEAMNKACPVPVIFISDHQDDVTFDKVRSLRPRHFLSKPIADIELRNTLHLVRDSIQWEEGKFTDRIEEGYFMIFYKGKHLKIKTEDVQWLEADRAYCKLVTAHQKYHLSDSMKAITDRISSKSNTLRQVHRSYWVNTEKMDHWEGNRIFIGEIEIPIGKSYRKEFKQVFGVK